jgi:hypothetical protein
LTVEDFNPTPWTAAQVTALDRAHQNLVRDYPNHYIAYRDEWDGEALTRTVVVAAPTFGEYMDKMEELPAEYCRTLRVTRVSSPDAPIFISRLLFRDFA